MKIKYKKQFKDMNKKELLKTKQLILDQIELAVYSRDHIRYEWYVKDLQELKTFIKD